MADNFIGNQRQVGNVTDPHQWTQNPLLTNPQQVAQYAMLAKGLHGMLQGQPDFEPIKQQYMRDYRNNTMPGIMNNATQSGFGQGSGLQQAVAGADTDLAYRLSALHQNFKQHQYDQNREQSNHLLQQGMKPSFENMYSTIPYEDASNYLKKQGVLNPTQQEINEVLPQFQPPSMLSRGDVTGGIQGGLRNARSWAQNTGNDISQAYNTGGLNGVGKTIGNKLGTGANNILFGEGTQTPQKNVSAVNAGRSEAAQGFLDKSPMVNKNFEKAMAKATPQEKRIGNEVLSDLVDMNAPILSESNLGAKDYQILRELLASENPKVQQLSKLVRTREELNKLRHYNKHNSKVRMGFFLRELINRENREREIKNQPLPKMFEGK